MYILILQAFMHILLSQGGDRLISTNYFTSGLIHENKTSTQQKVIYINLHFANVCGKEE